ncbi:hypothetical protein [Rhodopseudomonas palustris]|uniref:hypothetical protein n=1 Tax=Rhodopseudomonas palustris TaxID=1076 RepID=UPI0006425DB3|nr:hypothetical protein [Rhodopseudomonas palustris]
MTLNPTAVRARAINHRLGCGLHRAKEIDRAALLLDALQGAKTFRSFDDLCAVVREVILDQYRVRGIDLDKVTAPLPTPSEA